MSHITSIGASLYSDLSMATHSSFVAGDTLSKDTYAELQAYFATEVANVGGTPGATAFVRIANIREFPSIGTPPNIVNVPVYGQKTSLQIQGQADAPSIELTVNYVGEEWKKEAGCNLGMAVGDGVMRLFRFTLLNTEPTGAGVTKYASLKTGLGTAGTLNSQYFFFGKIDSLLVNPQLTDATTATIAITMNSAVFGAFTSSAGDAV